MSKVFQVYRQWKKVSGQSVFRVVADSVEDAVELVNTRTTDLEFVEDINVEVYEFCDIDESCVEEVEDE